jgi:hypothetical protein
MLNYRSAKVTGNGNVSSSSARLVAIHAVCGASAGSIVLKDGDGGTTLLDLDTPASATTVIDTYIGDMGIRFETNIHATLTNVTSVTCIFG